MHSQSRAVGNLYIETKKNNQTLLGIKGVQLKAPLSNTSSNTTAIWYRGVKGGPQSAPITPRDVRLSDKRCIQSQSESRYIFFVFGSPWRDFCRRIYLSLRHNGAQLKTPPLNPSMPYCCDVYREVFSRALNCAPWCREVLASRKAVRPIVVKIPDNLHWDLVLLSDATGFSFLSKIKWKWS